MTNADSEYKFIQLNRTFYELSKHTGDSDIRRAFHVRKRLGWAELTEEYRTIILSEAGTGKTEEIRHVAQTLRSEGKAAFFIRLEYIPKYFEDAFEEGSFEEFEAWLASAREGWLLLDSVDEARLRDPGDFELAIRKLGRHIKAAQQRVHIIITGRTTAWRPETDREHCDDHLRFEPPIVKAEASERSEDSGPNEVFHTQDQPEKRKQPVFKIVALEDLVSSQIESFAAAKGVKNTKAFLEAVERADAWSFTSRPQDLEELAQFWHKHGRIGNRLEIMRNSIDRRLAERDQGRADARPLSTERARQGARLVAAAVTLAQQATIRVPDGANNSKGIPIDAVLPDWDDKERATLLARPIFDEAIYGAVRFHHRSVREYLTAEWLAELLKRETSRRKIEALLFRNQYGLDVVVPTMRPILPWLAILDEKVCKRLRRLAPEVVLEGGDPSQLPLDMRRITLRQVCEQSADGASSRTLMDHTVVQRFANEDLVSDVKELIGKYVGNDDLIWFLLGMVWLGELKDALPEAKSLALSVSSSKHTRLAAFRAVRAVGAPQDMAEVRASFLAESAELSRDWLAELLESLEPSLCTTKWLLECLNRTEAKNPHSVDDLTNAVAAFAQRANVELLPQIVSGFNALLDRTPVIERRYCEISEKFGWLMRAAAYAVERLIRERAPATLKSDALAILHKFPISQQSHSGDFCEVNFEFSKLVPAWPELNRALFWHEATKARAGIDKKRGERLTDFCQVSMYGSFWHFDQADFDYVAEQISERRLPDDRLLALSLAFRLYVIGGRDPKRRDRLKKIAARDGELTARLVSNLRPPARVRQSWKHSEARRKRRSEARLRKEERNREDWLRDLQANPEKLRNNEFSEPGLISNYQHYVYRCAREKDQQSGRWTSGNWKSLIDEFGNEVAQAYRDGVVRFWREYRPKLRSEGAEDNTTPLSVIFGLKGLQIEANEMARWPAGLSDAEVELACRYASYELNGFPAWFPTLFAAYPTAVSNFLLTEIHYELSIEKPDTQSHYILNDVCWYGEWAWEDLAPAIYNMLKSREPANLSNLAHMLKIVQGSSIADAQISNLASRKSKALRRPEHAEHWFAVWTGVDPDVALPVFASHLDRSVKPEDRTSYAMRFITHLLGRGAISKVRSAFRTPEHLKTLYLLMNQHIRPKEDMERAGKGVYSPGLRDDAQDARNSLSESLRNIPGKDAFLALSDIAEAHPEETLRPWFALHVKSKAELDADIDPWLPEQVRDFNDKHERTPSNHRDLAELAHLRLLDLKDDLENGDSSIAGILQGVKLETDMRKYVGRELREKAFGRYSVPQEEEFADAKKPDLRFHGANFDGPVPAELKLADKWSGPDLFERLENQLCGDYLRDNRSNRGFFVLVYLGEKGGWDVPGSASRVDFEGLVQALEKHWEQLASKFPGVDDIAIIGIDLTKRSTGP
jgi:hypothetical protein